MEALAVVVPPIRVVPTEMRVIPWAVRSPVSSVIPRVIPSAVPASVISSPVSSVVPWVVPSPSPVGTVIPWIVPSVVSPWRETPRIPWVVMPAPVPRTSDAVWSVIIAVVVFEVVSPVVWVFAHRNDSSAQLLVISDDCRHVPRDHHGVLLLSEKIDRRRLSLLHKGLSVRL